MQKRQDIGTHSFFSEFDLTNIFPFHYTDDVNDFIALHIL